MHGEIGSLMQENIKKKMNKIKLSHNESIDVSSEVAENVNNAWNRWQGDKKNSLSSIMINNQNILMSSIRGVEFETIDDVKYYDLKNPDHKRNIREFEKELGNKKIKNYMIEKGAWVVTEKYPDGAVRNPKLYMELIRKNVSLHELRFLRERAKKHELEHLEKLSEESDIDPQLELATEESVGAESRDNTKKDI